MNFVPLIAKKRDGAELTADELEYLISSYARGGLADYQMSALAMAILLNGMTAAETTELTRCMLRSGIELRWEIDRPVVDKHSTGGVGDKVSIPLAPLLACCNVAVPMISGRGLGPTGGTLDKLESIPGFRTDLPIEEIQRIVREVGCVICGATDNLAPADRKLYALRDVTATVESIPLITSSILSKKLAEGLNALVLDVKFGSGAFMQTQQQATELAKSLSSVGNQSGVRTSALLTDMNQPLGRAAGNANEIDESIAVLKGEGPTDVTELTLALGAELLVQAGASDSNEAANALLQNAIDSGAGLEKFHEMVAAQGGDLKAPRRLASRSEIVSQQEGYVNAIDTRALGFAIIDLGGGRRKLGDDINHSVGIEMLVKIGQRVDRGEAMMEVLRDGELPPNLKAAIADAITISETAVEPLPLVVEKITG